jgi:hypothetical protein
LACDDSKSSLSIYVTSKRPNQESNNGQSLIAGANMNSIHLDSVIAGSWFKDIPVTGNVLWKAQCYIFISTPI